MTRMRAGLFAVVSISLASSSAALGQVWVLAPSPGPGVDFTSPQAAIDAAADGDAILVKPGSYAAGAGVVVSGKSLVIVGDTGGAVTFDFGLRVENLAPAQSVVLRGIDLWETTPSGGAGPGVLTLLNDQGLVWVEDSTLISFAISPKPALDVQQCTAVALERCSIRGADLTLSFGASPEGLRASSSSLALHECDVRGGRGGHLFPPTPGFDGGHGARAAEGFLFAELTRFIGGDGGVAMGDITQPCLPGGNGGHGLLLEGLAPQAWSQASQFLGGSAGAGCPPIALPGQPVSAAPGAHVALAGQGHAFEATSPVREGQFLHMKFAGQPGDLIFAAYSTQPGFAFLSAFGGVLLLGAPLQVAIVAAMPPSATSITASVDFVALGPGVEFARLFVQSAVFDPSTLAISLGGASSVLLLDTAF